MYYDIFFSNPQGQIVEEPDPPVDGVLINFPGPLQAVVYAVSERGTKKFHCLVTEEQLQQIEDDNVPFKFFGTAAENSFKAQPGTITVLDDEGNVVSTEDEPTQPWHGKAPAHVFNPAGVIYKDQGKNYIHKNKAVDPEEIGVEE